MDRPTAPVGAALLGLLLGRRSVSPRRLGPPGPDPAAVAQAVRAALRAPDHGALRPWRLIEFDAGAREPLAAAFVAEKLRRAADASTLDLARARAHALEPPGLFAFVARIDAESSVPVHEQWLAAGGALASLLIAFDALGFGAMVLSGPRCADPLLAAGIGVGDEALDQARPVEERLVGFVGVGRVVSSPPPAAETPVDRVWSVRTGTF